MNLTFFKILELLAKKLLFIFFLLFSRLIQDEIRY